MSRFQKIHPDTAGILHADPEVMPRFVTACIEEHGRQLSLGEGLILKNSPESAVTLVDIPGFPRVCVKEFRWRGLVHALKGFLRPTQGMRTYRNGWKLISAGIPVARPLALVREGRHGLVRSEFIVMEVIADALEMDRYIIRHVDGPSKASDKRELATFFGRFIGSMHADGIFHADLKTCNILVWRTDKPADRHNSHNDGQTSRTRTMRFALLDYDEVSFGRDVSQKKRVKNLLQIFLSTPMAFKALDRIRFLREYALHSGIDFKQRREIVRAILRAAKGREILYVGFQGDIREQWQAGKSEGSWAREVEP